MENKCDFIKIAKRINNNKRGYLVVNAKQGKHLPVSPTEALGLFSELADLLEREYKGERLLLIGFAETATAIGAHTAVKLGSLYMQTTRENIPNVEYIFFSEEHSHATEQKLVKNDIDAVIESVDRIIFIEDEVTTGKTIRNIVAILRQMYGERVKYSAASVINGMNDENIKIFNETGIRIHYLVKTNNERFAELVKDITDDGRCVRSTGRGAEHKEIFCGSYINARRLTCAGEYREACDKLWSGCREVFADDDIQNILVMGTEEFMYPALYVGSQLEKSGKNVRSHSTTRSPIAASSERDYPIRARYEITSLYDDERNTYLYNLDNYDMISVITDADDTRKKGINSLTEILGGYTDNIVVIRWFS